MSNVSNVSDFMQIVRTVYGSALQTALLRGIPYTIPEHTTLNEKFGVESGVQPTKTPTLRYYCIGEGGHRLQAGADGVPYAAPIRHRASDAALFKHLPFVMRQEGNDLTPDERGELRMRVLETVGNRNYICYYVKPLREDEESMKIIMEHTTVKDGVANTVPFIPSSENLKPVAPELDNREATTTNGDFLSVSNDVGIVFDANDVNALINVAKVRFDNPLRAVVSEIGLCTGVDKPSTGTGAGGSPIAYTEVVGCQIATHVTVYHAVGYTNLGFDIRVELGATEPMMGEGALGVTKTIETTSDNVRE